MNMFPNLFTSVKHEVHCSSRVLLSGGHYKATLRKKKKAGSVSNAWWNEIIANGD